MPTIPLLSGKGSSAWHTMLVGGSPLPGVASVKPKKGHKVDKKAGLGEDGATTTIQGKQLASATITLRTYKPEHIEELQGWLAILFPSGNPSSDPYAVSHPALAMLGITALFFETVDSLGPMAAPEQERLEVVFTVTEVRKAKPMQGGGSKTPQGKVDVGTLGPGFGKGPKGVPKAGGKTPPKVTLPGAPKWTGLR